jgi:hypothetical protein
MNETSAIFTAVLKIRKIAVKLCAKLQRMLDFSCKNPMTNLRTGCFCKQVIDIYNIGSMQTVRCSIQYKIMLVPRFFFHFITAYNVHNFYFTKGCFNHAFNIGFKGDSGITDQ